MVAGAWFGVLGPLEFRRGGETVVLSSGHQRSLLALLLLYAGEPLSRDRLIEELWGEAPPSSAVSALHVHVSKLRRLLGDLLVRVPAGYMLARKEIDLDVWRFDALVERARADPRAAALSLREALSLFRGEPLCDVECQGSLADWRRLLEERRLQARLSRFDAEFAEGAAGELVGELERLAGDHPFEERVVGQLMLALYRGGRQADALAAYERLRSRLDGELGLQPGEKLRVLQVAILKQDPSLVAAWPAERDPRMGDQAVPDELAVARADLARGAGGSSLPELATPTFGRVDAVEEIVGLLARGDVRLVTLTGPGGVGKTRLALLAAQAAAGEFADGAWWVELAGLPRNGDVAAAIVRALGVIPTGLETSEQALVRELAGRQLLLVLDNFEHVIERAPLVAVLHRGCPHLTVLVTSREGLDLAPEHRFVVWPLTVPAVDGFVTAEAVAAASASAMFLAAARRRDHGFVLQPDDASAVARICVRLEGLPLSLELAAARTTALSLQELADALDDQLEALGAGARDAPLRQRTLQATIEWSYGLLEPALQRIFMRFAVFAGGATPATAIAVTGAGREELEALVAKSLVVRRLPAGGGTRLVMLEAVRQHAQRLLAGDLAALAEVGRRHVEHYLRLVQYAAGRLSTREEPDALAELDSETENLHAARAWALVHDTPRALRLTGELALYWSIRGQPMALDWLDEAIAAAGQEAPLPDRALATLGRARALSVLQDRAAAVTTAQAALGLYQRAGDDAGTASTLIFLALETGMLTGELSQARRIAQEAIEQARRSGDQRLLAQALSVLAEGASGEERSDAVARAAAALTELGGDRDLVKLYNNSGWIALTEDRLEEARRDFRQALAVVDRIDNPSWRTAVLGNVGLCELLSGGDLQLARESLGASLALCVAHGFRYYVGEPFVGLAAIAALVGDDAVAAHLRGAAATAGYPHGETERELLDRLDRDYYTAARERIGDAAWDAARATGAAWQYERATADALAWAAERVAVDR